MFEGFEIMRNEKSGDETCDTQYTVWKNNKFFETERASAILNTTSLVCDSMSPVERQDESMAARYLDAKFDLIKKAGFDIVALYRNITKFKNGRDKKGNEKEDLYVWRIEVWSSEQKNVVGNIPTAKNY